MRISSKSILSPGRAGVRDPPNSLPASLSRRLRNSGSIKGGASPAMFPTAKKRGSFENPEPSSPKVTCIGQVRVRGKKKQAKKLRSLSRRHSDGSFKKLDHPLNGFPSKRHNHQESLNLGVKGGQNQDQNQESLNLGQVQRSWVHFPVTICEALKAFGSEFSCLIPCRTERGKVEKNVGEKDSCGAVFTRWLVAVQEKDIELVVGNEEENEDEDEDLEENVGRRRHVFEDLEIIDGRIEGQKDEARVSICIPPKNALLLMRCRSDPMKVEALANRSWEPTVGRSEEEDQEFVDCESHINQEVVEQEQKVLILDQDQENVKQDEGNKDLEFDNVQENEVGQDEDLENVQKDEVGQNQDLDNVQDDEVGQYKNLQELDNVQEYEMGQDQEHQEHENVQKYEVGQDQEDEKTEMEEESFHLASLFEETMNQDCEIQQLEAHEEDKVPETEAKDSTMATELAKISATHDAEMVNKAEETEPKLPECLLMMIHEPKLSLNVSKETWVCSKDFIRHPSNRRKPPPPPPPPGSGDGSSGVNAATVNDVKMVASGGFPAVLPQPGRSSCSLPAAPSMAAVLEQKLANAVGYEPFVLTRCKSEPMKTAAAKLLPESCVWENRKLERLSSVRFNIGAAGLGF